MNIKKLIVPMIFLVTVSTAQSMDESTTDKQRWPLQAQFEEEVEKAKQVPELKIILYKEAPEGEVLSLEHAQEMVSKLPLQAEGYYLELYFTLLSSATGSETPESTAIMRFEQAFMNDYRNRFPQEDKSNFEAAMLPLKDYFQQLTPPMIESWGTEKVKDEYEKAWKLLRTALKR